VKKQSKPSRPPSLVAVLDANVLYSAPLRDFFMRLTVRFTFQPKWTEEIHDEWMEAVLKNRPDLTRAQLERTRDLMNQYGNDWRVPSSYVDLIPTLSLTDPDDRHVLAAAIAAKAPVILTVNRSDFPASVLSGYGIRAVHPDDYALELLDAERERFLRAVKEHRASLTNPPKTVEEYLATLENCGLRKTAERLRTEAAVI
jgi:predicted nucleic acid-binding protein